MYPPIFEIVAADSDCQTNLGVSPTRFYPFGEAPQNVTKPYAVWQSITGFPENYINEVPDLDTYSVQVDVYGDNVDAVRNAAAALRNAIESSAHIIAWRGEERDPDTRNFRISFDADYKVSRETVS
jgi:uncharacterized protein YggE